jgi:hypothetical protein
MFQPVQIETQSEQQGLTHLYGQRRTRCACREFPFYGREQAFDQGAAPIDPLWKRTPHLRAHSVHAPGFLPALSGNHARRSEVLADVGMIALAVEFRVGQHQPDAGLFGSGFNDSRQIRTVVPRAAPRELRQHKLLIQIHGDHPLQPVPSRQRFLPVMMHAPHKERAHRALCQAGGAHGDASKPPLLAQRTAQPAHRFAHRAVDGLVVEMLQEAVQRREVGHAHKPQHLAQFAMLAQTHLGFPKGPVFVTHQAENGQQLRPGKPATAIAADLVDSTVAGVPRAATHLLMYPVLRTMARFGLTPSRRARWSPAKQPAFLHRPIRSDPIQLQRCCHNRQCANRLEQTLPCRQDLNPETS